MKTFAGEDTNIFNYSMAEISKAGQFLFIVLVSSVMGDLILLSKYC